MDTKQTDSIHHELFNNNPAFRELVETHQTYEKRLSELSDLHYPNNDEQTEEIRIKKKKLALKDEIYSMINDYSKKNELSH
jgi:uncharacterized protein YdcH (DUF465 family)